MEDIWFATKSKAYTFCVDAVKMRKCVLASYKENGKPKDWKKTEQGIQGYADGVFWERNTLAAQKNTKK